MIELTRRDKPPDEPYPPDRGDLPGDPTKPPKYLAQEAAAAGICREEEEELVGEQAGDPTKRPK
jgi:hypothetical protein